MERNWEPTNMNILSNKQIQCFLKRMLTLLIMLLLLGLVFSQIMIEDFKTQILKHDHELAGALLDNEVNPADITAAFIATKTQQDISAGQELLSETGYSTSPNNRSLEEVHHLLIKYRLIIFISIAVFGALLLTAFFLYFKYQQKDIDRSVSVISSFMDGNTSVRMESEEEGGLSKLYGAINTIATSLNAHIDDEKRTKEFLKATLTDVSHQLKTPLASMKMCIEIIQTEAENELLIKRFSTKAALALEHMEILIQSLLKITKLDAGTIPLHKTKQNVAILLHEIVTDFEIRMEQEHKTITLSGSDIFLLCDKDWMIEAIGNVIKNGLDHMEEYGHINISWTRTPMLTKIVIQDNGNGIHPADIHHIFKRFYRSRFSKDTQGIGLGLSLAKSIVEAHNGTISVNSTSEKGSTFTFEFITLTDL
ncbi:sensor histidine kinase [Paenibacillus donghaensis]|uniref:histidine kinase n=1 Tax=Paenibacillus donghaensis TaxID=414771 RepID=A0A2Z2KGM0_9BACL|nr:HAMP domain-containing sensor histidine kinase [Paenibacillus donghaensis]ASA22363.1 hypothetical protein B9T62_17165 [Paenibacillus donghaensis]